MNINYFKFEEGRKKEANIIAKRKQEFLGVRREERERVLNELLDRMKIYDIEIKLNELEKIIEELKQKDYEKHRKFN